MLRIKFIIKVIDGRMAVGKKTRGNVKAGLKLLLKDVQSIKDQLDHDYLKLPTHLLLKVVDISMNKTPENCLSMIFM